MHYYRNSSGYCINNNGCGFWLLWRHKIVSCKPRTKNATVNNVFRLEELFGSFFKKYQHIQIGLHVDDNYCVFFFSCRLLGYPFYISFLTPVLLILVGNFIAFVVIFRSLLSRSGSKVLPNRKVSGYQQARRGAAISVLLGLTWMFGILAINDHSKVVFQYLFCILNSLQGLLVFVFFCALPSGIRNKYRNFLPKSKKEKRKGRHMEMKAGAVKKMPNTEYSTSRDNTKDKHSTKGVYSFTNSIGQIVEFASYEKK